MWVDLLLPNSGTIFDIWIYTNFLVKHFFGRSFTTWWPKKTKSNAKIQICKNPDCRWACSWKLSWKTFRTCAQPVGKKNCHKYWDLLHVYNWRNKTVTEVSDPTTYQSRFQIQQHINWCHKKSSWWSNNPWKQKKKKTTQHVHYWPPNSKHVLIVNDYHIINKTSTVQWLCLLLPVSWCCVKVNVVCYPTRARHCSTRPSAQPFPHICRAHPLLLPAMWLFSPQTQSTRGTLCPLKFLK